MAQTMKLMHVLLPLGLGLAALSSVAAQSPSERDPVPIAEVAHEIEFRNVHGRPKWSERPVGKVGYISFFTSRAHKDGERAGLDVAAQAKRDVRDLMFDHLMPVLGREDTMAVLEPLIASATLVSAELGSITFRKGTADEEWRNLACLGWRAPVRPVVEKFDARQQGRIEWLLIRPVVYWSTVQQPPGWTSKLPARAGYVRCAFAHTAHGLTLARGSAIGAANRDVHSHLVELLAPAVGKDRAARAADAGVMRLGAVARATFPGRKTKQGVWTKPTAFCLWEVPIAPMLLALPKGLREVAKHKLQQRD